MTWFRVGGAGIPAALKNAMNAVFNKKFGTSGQDYPPNQWPADVNLMGPLPEGTASGSIAHITDGAGAVPLKSWEVTIDPTLTGKSAVMCTQTKKNILDFTVRSQYGITTTKGTDGGAIISGTASGGNVFVVDFVAMDLEAGKYNILVSGMQTGMTASWTKNGAYGGALNEGSNVITLSAKTKIGGYVRVTNGSSYLDPVTVYIQLTIGQDNESFEKYEPTQYTASLGRKIYGGKVDIVNGTGTETEKGKWLSELSWTQNATYPHVFNGTGFTDRKKGINWNNATCLSDRYTGYTSSEVGTKSEGIALATGATNTTIYVSDDRFETVEDFTASLITDDSFVVLPLETPTDFVFTPITPKPETPETHVATFYGDTGDSTVIYRRDIDLALQAVSSSRGLMMASRPVTQLVGEESDPDQVNELVENDETEQEGEDNAR